MILSTSEELNALLPANVSTSPERLLTLMEQTERTHIVPLLGKPLYEAVCQEYEKLHHGEAEDEEGNLMDANNLVSTESDHFGFKYTPMQQLIRLLQVPLVYMTLADNTGILSVSLNDGGMNMVSSEDYGSAKKDDREAFSRDCFRNAHKGMEQVLLYLEEDAHADEPVFLKLWSQSPTFYMQYGLLVPTATKFNQFVPIDDSRETYLSLVQRIRFVQDHKIRPELGDMLTDAIIQYAAFGPQEKDRTHNFELAACHSVVNSFEEDLREHLPFKRYDGITSEELLKLRGWNRLLLLLQTAVCFYVEMDNKKLRRPDSDKDAMYALERAKIFIQANTALFEGVIEDSPLHIKEEETSSTKPQCEKSGQRPGGVFDPLGSYYL